MTQLFRRFAAAAFAAASLAGPPRPALACGYDGLLGDGISAAHPASIPVALAVHDAVSVGRLPALDAAPPWMALMRAYRMVKGLHSALAQPGEAVPPVALLLVEARLWNRIVPVPFGLQLETHVTGPAAGDVVLVTGEPVLRALLDRRLGWDAAVADGLVRFSGGDEQRERLVRALAQRWPSAAGIVAR